MFSDSSIDDSDSSADLNDGYGNEVHITDDDFVVSDDDMESCVSDDDNNNNNMELSPLVPEPYMKDRLRSSYGNPPTEAAVAALEMKTQDPPPTKPRESHVPGVAMGDESEVRNKKRMRAEMEKEMKEDRVSAEIQLRELIERELTDKFRGKFNRLQHRCRQLRDENKELRSFFPKRRKMFQYDAILSVDAPKDVVWSHEELNTPGACIRCAKYKIQTRNCCPLKHATRCIECAERVARALAQGSRKRCEICGVDILDIELAFE